MFYGGLERLLGPPRLHNGSLHNRMQWEHCDQHDSNIDFQSSNGMTTKSRDEWEVRANCSSSRSSGKISERGAEVWRADRNTRGWWRLGHQTTRAGRSSAMRSCRAACHADACPVPWLKHPRAPAAVPAVHSVCGAQARGGASGCVSLDVSLPAEGVTALAANFPRPPCGAAHGHRSPTVLPPHPSVTQLWSCPLLAQFVVSPNADKEYAERGDMLKKNRTRKQLQLPALIALMEEQNVLLVAAKHVALIQEEVVGARLYTGPMCVRRRPAASAARARCGRLPQPSPPGLAGTKSTT